MTVRFSGLQVTRSDVGEEKLAGPEQAVAATHRHHEGHARIRRRKKFWRRQSWWATVGKAIVVLMVAVAVLFCMYLLLAGAVTSPQ